MLRAINNAIVIINDASKIDHFCVLQVIVFSLKFVGTVFVSSLFDLASASLTLSRIIVETAIILAKYFPFSQLPIAGFQTKSFSHILCFLHSRRHLSFFVHWVELHFLLSNLHLHSRDNALLMFSIHLFFNHVEHA